MNDIYFASVIKKHFSTHNCLLFSVAFSYVSLIIEDRELLEKFKLKIEQTHFYDFNNHDHDKLFLSGSDSKLQILSFLKELNHHFNSDLQDQIQKKLLKDIDAGKCCISLLRNLVINMQQKKLKNHETKDDQQKHNQLIEDWAFNEMMIQDLCDELQIFLSIDHEIHSSMKPAMKIFILTNPGKYLIRYEIQDQNYSSAQSFQQYNTYDPMRENCEEFTILQKNNKNSYKKITERYIESDYSSEEEYVRQNGMQFHYNLSKWRKIKKYIRRRINMNKLMYISSITSMTLIGLVIYFKKKNKQ